MADLRCAGAKWGHSRQLPVVLQLILQLGEVLDDALALLGLLLVGHSAHSSVEVINGTGLYLLAQALLTGGRVLTMMTGHRSLAETEAKLEGSEVKYWAVRVQLSARNKDNLPTYEFADRIPSFVLFFLCLQ